MPKVNKTQLMMFVVGVAVGVLYVTLMGGYVPEVMTDTTLEEQVPDMMSRTLLAVVLSAMAGVLAQPLVMTLSKQLKLA